MVRYVDEQRDVFGVEPICKQLQVAQSTYYAARSRPPSLRAQRDSCLIPILVALWTANFKVYGVRKLWKAAQRAGHDVGRDQVARLMKMAGIEGLRRGKKHRTTKPDAAAQRHPDLVNRRFVADRPNRLWVSDITYVATWSGFAYVCFITDAFSRMIVAWRVATHMRTEMVLDALQMARWKRGTTLEGLVSHSDAGGQGEFNWSSQHLDDGGFAWAFGNGSEPFSSIEGRFRRLDDRQWPGARIGSGSGRQSLVACRPRTRRKRRACPRRSRSGGSVTLGA